VQNGCSCFCRYSIPPHRLSPDSSFTQRIISGAWIKEIVDWCNEQVEDARAAMFLYQRFKEEWEQNLRHRVDPAYVNTLGTLRSQKAARWFLNVCQPDDIWWCIRCKWVSCVACTVLVCSIQMFLVWKIVPSEVSSLEHLALFCSKAELGSCPKKGLVKRECNLASAQFVRIVTGIFCCWPQSNLHACFAVWIPREISYEIWLRRDFSNNTEDVWQGWVDRQEWSIGDLFLCQFSTGVVHSVSKVSQLINLITVYASATHVGTWNPLSNQNHAIIQFGFLKCYTICTLSNPKKIPYYSWVPRFLCFVPPFNWSQGCSMSLSLCETRSQHCSGQILQDFQKAWLCQVFSLSQGVGVKRMLISDIQHQLSVTWLLIRFQSSQWQFKKGHSWSVQVSKIFNILSEFVSVNPDCVKQYLLSLRVWSLMISSCFVYKKLYGFNHCFVNSKHVYVFLIK
jgi:hypothetical protein